MSVYCEWYITGGCDTDCDMEVHEGQAFVQYTGFRLQRVKRCKETPRYN